MTRRSWSWTLAILGVSGALYAGYLARNIQDAERLVTEAGYLLNRGLERAPELEDLEAGRARMLLSEALELHPRSEWQALEQRARALVALQKADPDAALKAAEQARKLGDASAALQVVFGTLALRRGQIDQAAGHAAAALKLAPNEARAQLLQADVLRERGDSQAALGALDALLGRAPRAAALYDRRGLLHEVLADHAAAARDYERSVALAPEAPAGHLNQGRLLRRVGRLAEAEQAFGRAIDRGPETGRAWLGRGLCRLEQGDALGAGSDLDRARELLPEQPAPLVALSDLATHARDHERAVVLLQAATAIDAHDAVSWLKLGNAWMRRKDPGKAREAYRQALGVDQTLAAAHNGLGAALIQLGEGDAAEAELGKAAELDANDPNPLLNLARLREQRGDAAGAERARELAANL
jgi:protein O-GlcNAc transferase